LNRSLPVQRFSWVGFTILDLKMSESSANPQASALSRKPSSEFPFFRITWQENQLQPKLFWFSLTLVKGKYWTALIN
jgi:hypothetical protein